MFNGVYNDNDASCQTVLVTIQSAPRGEKNCESNFIPDSTFTRNQLFFLEKTLIFWFWWLTNCEGNRAVINFSKPNSPVSIGFWLPFKKDSTEEMHTHTKWLCINHVAEF